MTKKILLQPFISGATPCTNPCNTTYFPAGTALSGGAAVMQMVLHSARVGVPIPVDKAQEQKDWFNEVGTNSWNTETAWPWGVDPGGMRQALETKKTLGSPSFHGGFVIYEEPNRDALNTHITFTIDWTDYEVAPAVLINSGKQWLAVVGYERDASGQLLNLWVMDPKTPGTEQGNSTIVSAPVWGTDPYYLMNPVSTNSMKWGGKFIAVVDPRLPTETLTSAVPRPRADGVEIISPERAIEFARQILEDEGFVDDELYARALESGRPAEPSLVQRLDESDSFYYLVRYQHKGRDMAVVALDARFGVFLEATAFPEPVGFFAVERADVPSLLAEGVPIRPSVQETHDRILRGFLRSETERGSGVPPFSAALDLELARLRDPHEFIRFRDREIVVHPLMVSDPCGEASLLYPSYMVNTPRKTVYVRAADRKVSIEDDCVDARILGT